MDTNLPENDRYDRSLTDYLYGGDLRYRLCQEVVLGIGGLRMLRVLGFDQEASFHMNEGHSALLALELFFEELAQQPDNNEGAVERVRRKCLFTTHTPVPAGHDQFTVEVARGFLGERRIEALHSLGCCGDGLNMTRVALSHSHYVNGVTQRHGRISSSIFPVYPIGSITNGVHSATWSSPPFQALYDRHIKDWRRDCFSLRYALGIPPAEISRAHAEAKSHLIELVNERTNMGFDTRAFSIGCARRVATYERLTLLFHDLERLRAIAARFGKAADTAGRKAHPQDFEAKALIQQIVHWSEIPGPQVLVGFLPSYDLAAPALRLKPAANCFLEGDQMSVTALVVDDSAAASQMIGYHLHQPGCTTIGEALANATDALKRLRELKLNIVSLDLMIPIKDDFDSLALVRKKGGAGGCDYRGQRHSIGKDPAGLYRGRRIRVRNQTLQ